jgi:hypothetical protein
VTNTVDSASVKKAAMGEEEMPKVPYLTEQYFCVVKARKGEGAYIPVRRDFLYQRFMPRIKV